MPYLPAIPAGRIDGDPELAQRKLLKAARDMRDVIDRLPLIGGVHYAPGVALVNGDNVIEHRLGRTPSGWIVTRATGAVPQLYETDRNDKTITLNSTGTPVVEVWFF